MTSSIHEQVDSLFRREAGKLTAILTRVFGPEHLQMVEDVVQETLVKALRHWNTNGLPDFPSAWLLHVAKNQARDLLRREARLAEKVEAIGRWIETQPVISPESECLDASTSLGDDRLRLMFMCCHPVLSRDSQVCLILRTLCGLSVAEIAGAYFVQESAIAQRLVRARKTLKERNVSFDIPDEAELPLRLETVLEALYLLFNEGYSAHSGDEHVRIDLCDEAIYLVEMLARHAVGDEPQVHALRALMLFQASRLPARLSGAGDILLLSEQDRSQWDQALAQRGFAALQCSATGTHLSRYHLEAGIASIHATGASFEETDWSAIVDLYDALLELTGSALVALNRAAALAMRDGPEAGLTALDSVRRHPALCDYHMLAATEGFLYRQSGDLQRAKACYTSALALAPTEPERRFLQATLDSIQV